jgi:hypothetical protein
MIQILCHLFHDLGVVGVYVINRLFQLFLFLLHHHVHEKKDSDKDDQRQKQDGKNGSLVFKQIGKFFSQYG